MIILVFILLIEYSICDHFLLATKKRLHKASQDLTSPKSGWPNVIKNFQISMLATVRVFTE